MKVWLDDIRNPPDGTWYWAQTFDEMMFLLKMRFIIEELSLDNDLGEGQPEGRKVVLYMAEHNFWPKVVKVHSANPVAREYMEKMIERYKP